MVFLPVKPLGPFEHVHEGKRNGLNIEDQSFMVFYLSHEPATRA